MRLTVFCLLVASSLSLQVSRRGLLRTATATTLVSFGRPAFAADELVDVCVASAYSNLTTRLL